MTRYAPLAGLVIELCAIAFTLILYTKWRLNRRETPMTYLRKLEPNQRRAAFQAVRTGVLPEDPELRQHAIEVAKRAAADHPREWIYVGLLFMLLGDSLASQSAVMLALATLLALLAAYAISTRRNLRRHAITILKS